VGGYRLITGVAGEVGLVDQPAQRVLDLGGPVRVGVGLGGVFQITQDVRIIPTSG
jgi:hypothetical protein